MRYVIANADGLLLSVDGSFTRDASRVRTFPTADAAQRFAWPGCRVVQLTEVHE